ncbi:NADPH-dependent FMN reductase [Alicyclobacillus acidiphilus]|uniref:NADPH-dependent FMN reductase n=1 Tax=Alicyclobacillus acidiphilus TaxID=182455 RepID=UPI000834C896|nr:NAD(P)H-dependent oxidoreductase [Alicyclobacillus acidiphilus]
MPKIGVIISTTRDTRFGDKVAEWFMSLANERSDLQFELVDLRDYPLPFFNEKSSNLYMPTENAEGQRWQKKVGEFDGYVIVTAEYNHAPSAVLKNALDYAYVEWVRKPVAFVGYGAVGAARAVEQLRQIAVELQMAPIRSAVHIQGGDFMQVYMGEKKLEDLTYLPPLVTSMLDDLVWWANALKTARESQSSAK